jgi:hypothetical protein
MTADELLAEARRIARPCIHLTASSKDGPLAGLWQGKGVVPVKAPEHKHWLSLDCSQLRAEFSDLKLTGVLSIYTNEEDCEGGICAHDPKQSLDGAKGKQLFAKPATTLPALTSLLRSNTPLIKKWLEEIGARLDQRFITYQKGIKELTGAYHKAYQATDPKYDAKSPVYAGVGGWPNEIYEDEWAEEVNDPKARQLAFTFRDSEPWVQVWVDGKGKFHVRQIIT